MATVESIPVAVTITPCRAGYGGAECIPCATGRYKSIPGPSLCQPCAAGTATDEMGSIECAICAAGKAAWNGSAICTSCESGKASHSHSGQCDDCTPGLYSSEPEWPECKPCSPGSYAANSRATKCLDCPRQHRCPRNGTVDPIVCEAGWHQPVSGSDRCIPCPSNGWSREGEECTICPVQSYATPTGCLRCTLGLSCSEGVVRADDGYWLWKEIVATNNMSWVARAMPCLRDRCIGDDSDGTTCSPNRYQNASNILCRECLPGFAEWGPTSECVQCDRVYGERIFGAIILVGVMMFVIHILAQSESGMPSVFFYYCQMVLLLAPPARWFSWLQIFSGAPSWGFCVAPLKATERWALTVSMPAMLLVMLAIILLLQSAIGRFCGVCGRSFVERRCWPTGRWKRSLIDVYLTTYVSVGAALVTIFACEEVMNEVVVLEHPTILCSGRSYDALRMIALIILVFFIILPPIVGGAFLSRHSKRLTDPSLLHRWGPAYEAYRSDTWWWQGVVIIRRIVFVSINIQLSTWPLVQHVTFACVHWLSLLLHLWQQPYKHSIINKAESGTLMTLSLLSVILTAFPSLAAADDDDDQRLNKQALQAVVGVLVLSPIAGFAMYLIPRVRALLCNKRSSSVTIVDEVYAYDQVLLRDYSIQDTDLH